MTDSPVGTYPAAGTLDDVLGFELLESSAEGCRGRFAVERRVQQPMGLVHGGAYAALAEAMVSLTTHRAVEGNGSTAVGQSNHTTFLRPVTGGQVHAVGRPLHRGRTSWVWDVDFTDDESRLCATTRVILAVRPATPTT
ncbi:MAG TPA: PaaI family thioesterase [Thermoleophilaceae bacterium]|nr:PaaI family thioesterase [Thermoleophilaceae bacterium]